MGKLDKILGGCSGYYRTNCEDEFPWNKTDGIWYSLIVVEGGKIETYGFTSAEGNKDQMRIVLQEIISEGLEAMLLGVWNGKWKSHLFILDIEKAIDKLKSPTSEMSKRISNASIQT